MKHANLSLPLRLLLVGFLVMPLLGADCDSDDSSDGDGGSGAASLVSPVIESPADGSIVDTARPMISGIGTPGCTIRVYEVGVDAPLAAGLVSEMRTWAVAIQDDLAEGSHTIYAVQTNTGGGLSDPSPNVTFTVDTFVGAPTITSPVDGAIVNTSTVTFDGTSEARARVELSRVAPDSSLTLIGETSASDAGLWSIDVLLSDGTHTVCAKAIDEIGNVSDPSNEVGITVDTVAPARPGQVRDGGTVTRFLDLVFEWDAVADVDVAGYYLLVTESSGTTPVLWEGDVGNALTHSVTVPQGTTAYARVYAYDEAGNQSAYSPVSDGILADTTAPGQPGQVMDAGEYSSSALLVFNWTAAQNVTNYLLRIGKATDGDDLDPSSLLAEVQLPDGTLTYSYASTVADGTAVYGQIAATNLPLSQSGGTTELLNWSPVSDGIIVDQSAPVAPGAPVDAGSVDLNTSVDFTWSAASDNHSGIADYRIQIGTAAGVVDVLDQSVGTDTGVVLSITSSALIDQPIYARIVATNGAGLTSSSGWSDGVTLIDVEDGYEENDNVLEAWDFRWGEDQLLSSYGGEMGYPADKDLYKIIVLERKTLIEAECDFGAAGGTLDLVLKTDGPYQVVASDTVVTGTAGIRHNVALDGFRDGELFLRVWNGTDRSVPYDLWWRSSDPPEPIIEVAEESTRLRVNNMQTTAHIGQAPGVITVTLLRDNTVVATSTADTILLALRNSGPAESALQCTAVSDKPWLQVAHCPSEPIPTMQWSDDVEPGPAGLVNLRIDPRGLIYGTHSGTVTFSDPMAENNPQELTVQVVMQPQVDVYEDDGTALKSSLIQVGESQTHTLHNSSDVDWVHFTAPRSTEIVVQTSGAMGDTRLTVYDESQNPLTAQVITSGGNPDSDGGIGEWSRVVFEAQEGRLYYARVEPENVPAIGNYNFLVLEKDQGVPDLTIAGVSGPGAVLLGSWFNATVTVENVGTATAEDFEVGFWWDSSDKPLPEQVPDAVVRIDKLDAGSTIDVTFRTRDHLGSYTAWAYADIGALGGQVVETNETNNVGPAGGYTWNVSEANPDIYEEDDTLAMWSSIEVGETQYRSVSPGDPDCMRLILPADMHVTIETDGLPREGVPAGDTVLELIYDEWDPYNEEYINHHYTDDNGGRGLYSRLSMGLTRHAPYGEIYPAGHLIYYYIRVTSAATIDSYSITVRGSMRSDGIVDVYEYDDLLWEAKEIDPGETQYRHMGSGDIDCVKLDLLETNGYVFSMNFSFRAPYMKLYNQGGDLLAIMWNDFELTDYPPGVYYVKLYGGYGDYDITLSQPTLLGEPNNTLLDATEILVGTSQEHGLVPEGDEDWFWFMSLTEATITIRTDGDAGDTVLELYEDGAASNPVVSPSTNVWADDHHGPGLRFSQITYVVQANTMYWIRVSGKPNIPTPNYTLSVLSGPIAPDLVVTDIWTVPANPITTEDVVIYVEVENIGYETVVVRPLVRLVCLPVGAADIGFNERFAYTADANIWPGHTTTAEFHFNTLPEGGHDIHAPSYSEMRATVDYDDQVSEMDETNNTGPLHQELLPFPYYYMP